MFWDKIIELCNENGISPSKLCEKLDFSNATATKWKNGATPHDSTLKKISDYFNVSIDFLKEETKKDSHILNYGESPTKYKIKELVDTILEQNNNEEELNALRIVLEKFVK